MIVTLNWLKDFIDLNETPEKIAELLTNSGNEVEEIIYQDKFLKNVVVGKILKIEKHPNADKLVVCQVDIGDKVTQIVTAATNVREGHTVPVSLPGANLANGIHIENGKLRGVDSLGMFCSIEELGVTDYDGEANGIMILDDDLKAGTPIAKALMMDDVIFDINVTANRPDCMSVIGIARELSALTGKPIKKQDLSYKTNNEDINKYLAVEVQNKELCPRYMASVVKNIKIEKSPKWLRARLVSVGIKPINNIVDITNYVLMEYGQPMHAFDYDYLDGHKIVVRDGKVGEEIKVLNHNSYDVDEKMLCVCDSNKPVVIAGIIGGLNSCVIDDTKTAVLEAASFNRASIRRTSRRIGVRTDSTARFEKGVDVQSPEIGMQRALNLISKLGAGEIVSGVIDSIDQKPTNKDMTFSISKIEKLLGIKVPNEKILSILNNLGIKSTIDGDTIYSNVPVYRGDIENNADIAEEIIRMYGYSVYDSIDQEPLANAKVTVGRYDPMLQTARKLKLQLCDYGYYETVNYSICSEDVKQKLLLKENTKLYNMIKIENPISEDLSCVRTTMANAMFTTIARNLSRKNQNFRLSEVGRVYFPKELPLKELPDEVNMLSFASVNKEDDFFTFKGMIENLLRDYDLDYKLEYSKLPFMHPGISADIIDTKTGEVVGSFGKVHPKVCKNFDMSEYTFYAELNLDIITSLKAKKHEVKMLSKFPAVDRDLAIVCDETVTVEQVLECVKKSCGKLYYSSKVFDIYRSEQLGENKKSIAFSFKLISYDKTLTDEEINQTVNKILKDLKYKLGAVLR